MNVTFVISTLAKGGSERVTSILANRFSEGQYKVTILTLFNSKISYDINTDINIISLGQEQPSDKKSFILKLYHYLRRIIELGQYFRNKNETIIVIGSDILNATIAISKFLYNFKSKLILTIRSNPIFSRKLVLRKIIYSFYKFADLIIVQSLLNKEFIANQCPKNRTEVIKNPSTFKNHRRAKENTKYDFLTVGRIHPLKNQLDIVKAIKILNLEQGKKFNLCIVGRNQGGKKKILNYIKKHNLDKYIFLKGEVDDMYDIYNKSKFFVHYSNYEGQSNVVIEAQLLGLPSIVSNFQGIEEIIMHNHNGLVVDKNNPKLLAQQMNKLASNSSLQKKITNSSQKLSDQYTIDNIFNRWNELLIGLV